MTREDQPVPGPDAGVPGEGVRAAVLHGAAPRAAHAWEQKAAEHLAGWQRARADYQNLERRSQAEILTAAEAGRDACLRALLPVVDAFTIALAQAPAALKAQPWVEGVFRIRQALDVFLREQGVTAVAETGVPFDPSCHEAVGDQGSEFPKGAVAKVVAPGYRRNGRLLRPAKVLVSRGRAP